MIELLVKLAEAIANIINRIADVLGWCPALICLVLISASVYKKR